MKYIFYVIVFVMCIVLPTDCHSSDAYYELINTKDGFEVRYRSFKWELTITGSPYTIKFEGYPQTHIYVRDLEEDYPLNLSLTLPRKGCKSIYRDIAPNVFAYIFCYDNDQFIILQERSDEWNVKRDENFTFFEGDPKGNDYFMYEYNPDRQNKKRWEHDKGVYWGDPHPDYFRRLKKGRVNFSYYKDGAKVYAVNILPMWVPIFKAYIENTFQVKSDFENEYLWHSRLEYEKNIREGKMMAYPKVERPYPYIVLKAKFMWKYLINRNRKK